MATKQKYDYVGIDFGTSTTYVYGRNLAGEVISLASFESTVGDDGNKFYVGVEIERAGLDESQIYKSIKSKITDWNTEVGDADLGTDISEPLSDRERAALQYLFTSLIEQLKSKDVDLNDVPNVKFGCPANWNQAQRKYLLDLLKSAGVTSISLRNFREEPIAAGLDWLFTTEAAEILDPFSSGRTDENGNFDRFDTGANVLIFDMGGGTLDLALIEFNKKNNLGHSVNVLSSIGSTESNLAGDALDLKICNSLGIAQSRSNLAACKRVKELLTDSTEVSLGERFPDEKELKSRNLSRQDLNKIFSPQLDRALALAEKCVSIGILGTRTRRSAKLFGWVPFQKLEAGFDAWSEEHGTEVARHLAEDLFPEGDIGWKYNARFYNDEVMPDYNDDKLVKELKKKKAPDKQRMDHPNSFNQAAASITKLRNWSMAEKFNKYVDVILLAGGMSQIPLVKETLEEKFPQVKVILVGRPQETVGMGLATDTSKLSEFDSLRIPFDIKVELSGVAEPCEVFKAFDLPFESDSDFSRMDFCFGRERQIYVDQDADAEVKFFDLEGKPLTDVTYKGSYPIPLFTEYRALFEEHLDASDLKHFIQAYEEYNSKQVSSDNKTENMAKALELAMTFDPYFPSLARIPIAEFEHERGASYRHRVTPGVPLVINLYLDGRLYVRDSNGFESIYQVSRPEDGQTIKALSLLPTDFSSIFEEDGKSD